MTTGDGGGSGSQWQKCSVVLTAVNWKKGCIGDGIFEFYELVYISIILFLCGALCVGCVCVCSFVYVCNSDFSETTGPITTKLCQSS